MIKIDLSIKRGIIMSLQDLEIRYSYRSKGPENIVDSFLNPALSKATLYKRSAGFFSSSVYELIGPGIKNLVNSIISFTSTILFTN